MSNDSEYLLLDEVARKCRTSVSTVRVWLAAGRFPSIRPGRRRLVRRDALQRFLDQSAPPPATATAGDEDAE